MCYRTTIKVNVVESHGFGGSNSFDDIYNKLEELKHLLDDVSGKLRLLKEETNSLIQRFSHLTLTISNIEVEFADFQQYSHVKLVEICRHPREGISL